MRFHAALWRNYYDDNIGSVWRSYGNDNYGFIGNYDVTDTLNFGTQLHGGFGTSTFEIKLPQLFAAMRYYEFLGAHVVIFDRFGDRAYEGHIVDSGLEKGVVSLSTDGYYSHANYIMMPTGLWTSPTTTIADIVKDCVDYIEAWNQTFAFIADANFIVGPQDTNEESKVNEILEKILKFGYREDYLLPLYFAIWNHRIPYLFPEPDLEMNPYPYPDWLISAKSIIGEGAGTRVSLENVFNKVYALFDDTADDSTGPTLTTAAQDYTSQYLYGVREGVVNTGEYGQSIGEDLRDMALQKYRFPVEQISLRVGPLVQQFSGAVTGSYKIRAGDLILVKDLDEAHMGYAAGKAKILRGLTGFVMSTDYSAKDGTLDIQLGVANQKFEYIMARLGLDGGLS